MKQSYDRITKQVIERLKHGVVPWRQPWHTACNLVSGQPYRGVNVLLLSTLGHESPWWLTYQQAQQLGGTVRKGEHGIRVIYWKPPIDEEEEKRPPLLKTYTVFNLEQCDGITAPPRPTKVDACDNIAANMPLPPTLTIGKAASYEVRTDTVTMPTLQSFETTAGFYATLFHELIHATGHEQRLNRPGVTGKHRFKSNEYAKEELVAEIGAAFLCGETGINPQTIENSAAYIAGWLKILEAQPSILVQAAAAAQKAADYVRNREACGTVREDIEKTMRYAKRGGSM
jgi:antirestriction protein ArdC